MQPLQSIPPHLRLADFLAEFSHWKVSLCSTLLLILSPMKKSAISVTHLHFFCSVGHHKVALSSSHSLLQSPLSQSCSRKCVSSCFHVSNSGEPEMMEMAQSLPSSSKKMNSQCTDECTLGLTVTCSPWTKNDHPFGLQKHQLQAFFHSFVKSFL